MVVYRTTGTTGMGKTTMFRKRKKNNRNLLLLKSEVCTENLFYQFLIQQCQLNVIT